ncbi:MAG: hypothetical protein AAF674_19445 [Pseudomonadota bacterium]
MRTLELTVTTHTVAPLHLAPNTCQARNTPVGRVSARRGPWIVLLTAMICLAPAPIALACACELECPEGEVYSDEAEMCVDATDAVS